MPHSRMVYIYIHKYNTSKWQAETLNGEVLNFFLYETVTFITALDMQL